MSYRVRREHILWLNINCVNVFVT